MLLSYGIRGIAYAIVLFDGRVLDCGWVPSQPCFLSLLIYALNVICNFQNFKSALRLANGVTILLSTLITCFRLFGTAARLWVVVNHLFSACTTPSVKYSPVKNIVPRKAHTTKKPFETTLLDTYTQVSHEISKLDNSLDT